jgi:phospholipid/cholesterol/gamma-HCH transport system ATP-binding protein
MNAQSDLLEMRDVELQFDEKKVLDRVNLSIRSQERLVVMGRSGSGKSTMLRLVMGIIKPNAGSIRFKAYEVTKLKGYRLDVVRQKIGMLYQSAALISSLTVRNNLALPLQELTDKTPGEIEEIIDEKLELVGLQNIKDKLPGELSGGMKKRVGLARALVMQPELILFDEPSAGLDPVSSSSIDDLIMNLTKKTKATSIIVTHDMQSAFRIATRIAMLHEGKIIEDGTPEDLRKSKNPVVSQFLSGDLEGPLTKET